MAELRGAMGAVFKGAAAIFTSDLDFGSGNEIVNSAGLFVAKGFDDDQKIRIYGSASNDGAKVIDTVTADTIVLTTNIVSETAATSILIYTDAPGTAITGFYGWSFDNSVNTLDATDFLDAGTKTYIAGASGWTASAQAHWMTDEDVEQYIGTELLVRFFVKYTASPSGGSPVYMYEGMAIVTGIAVDTKPQELVERPLQFNGVGPLIYRSLTAYA